jgi:hypothetical protein
MNTTHFDQFTRRLSQGLSRRRVLTAMPAAGLGMLVAGGRQPAEAGQERGHL